jgi:hypothetical protein
MSTGAVPPRRGLALPLSAWSPERQAWLETLEAAAGPLERPHANNGTGGDCHHYGWVDWVRAPDGAPAYGDRREVLTTAGREQLARWRTLGLTAATPAVPRRRTQTHANPCVWTAPEVALLRVAYATTPTEELAHMLGRVARAVARKARQLNLHKARPLPKVAAQVHRAR